MTKERIEDIRQSVIPFVKKELLEINNDGLGESDAKEFEKDLNEVLDLASKALEKPNIEVIAIEDAAKTLGCNTINSTYAWLSTLGTLEKCGYAICKVEGV